MINIKDFQMNIKGHSVDVLFKDAIETTNTVENIHVKMQKDTKEYSFYIKTIPSDFLYVDVLDENLKPKCKKYIQDTTFEESTKYQFHVGKFLCSLSENSVVLDPYHDSLDTLIFGHFFDNEHIEPIDATIEIDKWEDTLYFLSHVDGPFQHYEDPDYEAIYMIDETTESNELVYKILLCQSKISRTFQHDNSGILNARITLYHSI